MALPFVLSTSPDVEREFHNQLQGRWEFKEYEYISMHRKKIIDKIAQKGLSQSWMDDKTKRMIPKTLIFNYDDAKGSFEMKLAGGNHLFGGKYRRPGITNFYHRISWSTKYKPKRGGEEGTHHDSLYYNADRRVFESNRLLSPESKVSWRVIEPSRTIRYMDTDHSILIYEKTAD